MNRRQLIKSFTWSACIAPTAIGARTLLNLGVITANPHDYIEIVNGMVRVMPSAASLKDCTSVFQAAHDLAHHTKRSTIYIPPGKYHIPISIIAR